MTDSSSADPAVAPASTPTTAGGLLRRARQAQGLHIAALAASIKVTPRKLEALESDQFNELPDATFTRALAQTVCRTLKIDPAPVLALLPPPNGHRLEEVAEGLKTPFNERPGRLVPGGLRKLSGVTLWAAAALIGGAALLYLMPAAWTGLPRAVRAASAPEPDAASTLPEPTPPGAEPVPAVVAERASGVPALGPAPVAVSAAPEAASAAVPGAVAPAASAAPAGVLQFKTSEAAWIGVTDAKGKSLIGRLVQPSEAVDLDGSLPLTLRVGNANHVRLVFHGDAVDLSRFTRDNVARLQLK